jgi:hypothetical protein
MVLGRVFSAAIAAIATWLAMLAMVAVLMIGSG